MQSGGVKGVPVPELTTLTGDSFYSRHGVSCSFSLTSSSPVTRIVLGLGQFLFCFIFSDLRTANSYTLHFVG